MLRADSRLEVGVLACVKGRVVMVARSKGRYHPSIEVENEMNASLEPGELVEEEENWIVRFVREVNTNTLLPFFTNYSQFRSINIRYRDNPQS